MPPTKRRAEASPRESPLRRGRRRIARKDVGRSGVATPPKSAGMPSNNNNNNKSPPVVERSPSNRAKCRGCGQLIAKGEGRIGTPYKFDLGRHVALDKHRYYHPQCCPSSEMKKLFPASDNLQKACQKKFRTLDQKKEREEKLVQETRGELRQRLRKLRLKLFEAQAEKEGSVVILSLQAVDSIVLAMPKTLHDLGRVKGIGPTILKEYGKPLLKEVRRFHNMNEIRRFRKERYGGGGDGSGRAGSSSSDSDSDSDGASEDKFDALHSDCVVDLGEESDTHYFDPFGTGRAGNSDSESDRAREDQNEELQSD